MKNLVITLLVMFAVQYTYANKEKNPYGYWNGFGLIINMKDCEENICGVIEHIFVSGGKDPIEILDENNQDKTLRSRTLIGSNILYDFSKRDEKGVYTGRIYNPEDGKSYKSKIRVLDSGNLEVKGCITLICRKTGEWLPLRVELNEDGKRVASLANPLAIF
jgi:uncharacterized protein (DUF2147 family)